MKIEKTIKSDQEQAVASWINYLNQLRLDTLTRSLSDQDRNFSDAMDEFQKTMGLIQNMIEVHRKNPRMVHGFIAEIAETGVNNAQALIRGNTPIYEWLNDNSETDLMVNGIPYQLKFYENQWCNSLSLDAVKKHLSKYPDYITNGGRYRIPRNQYQKINYYLTHSLSETEEMPVEFGASSRVQYLYVNRFFRDNDISFSKDIEPSRYDYSEVQVDTINETMGKENQLILDTDKEIRKTAFQKSLPSVRQGFQSAVVSAGVEGGFTLAGEIIHELRSGKKPNEITAEDWTRIFKKSGVGFIKGGVRGISIYTLTNFNATPASVASSIVTASFGIAEQAHLLRCGAISEEEYIFNSEILCVDASVSALSSFLGQALIPIPILGAVIGNTIGSIMYNAAKDRLSKKERYLIEKYINEIEELDKKLDRNYRELLAKLTTNLSHYFEILDLAFAVDCQTALQGSSALALYVGVPMDEILRTLEDIDDYFLN